MGMAHKGAELWILRHCFWIILLVAIWIPLLPVLCEETDFPSFSRQPESRIVPNNVPLTLRCVADPPGAHVRWLYNGNPLDERRHSGLRVDEGSSSLVFSQVEASSGAAGDRAGEYRCTATNHVGTRVSRPAILEPPVLHDFDGQLNDVTIRVPPGGYVTLSCDTPRSVPPAKVAFVSRDGTGRLTADQDNIQALPSGKIVITDVTTSDSGRYACVAENPLSGDNKTSPATITINMDDSLKDTPPMTRILTDKVERVEVIEGHDVILECPSYGDRRVNITWSMYGGRLPLGRSMEAPFGNLKIIQAQHRDTGTYKCSGPPLPTSSSFSSPSPLNEARVYLEVLQYPSVAVVSTPDSVEEGDKVVLTCRVRGIPIPNISWFHNGQKVNQALLQGVEEGTLTIQQASLADAGIYQCMATNKLGTSEDLHELDVFEDDGDDDEVEADVDDLISDLDLIDSSETDPKRKGGKKDRKKLGKKKKLRMREKVKKKPDKNRPKYAPSKPSITQLSDRTVMVNWTVSDMGDGQAIKFFKIQYREMSPDKGSWQTNKEEIRFDTHRYEVKDLKPDGFYKFRVFAVYEDDDNRNSDSETFKMAPMPYLPTAPDAVPTIVEAKPVVHETTHGIGIRWQLKTEPKSNFEGFIISFKPFQSQEYKELFLPEPKIRKYVIRNLLPNTSYSIRMCSFNAGVNSKYSNTVVKSTRPRATDSSLTDPYNPAGVGGGANGIGQGNGQQVDNRDGLPPLPEDRSTLSNPPSSGHHSGNNTLEQPVILGIVLGALLLALAILVTMCWWKQRQQKRNTNDNRKFQDQSQCIYADTSTIPNMSGTKSNGGLYPHMGNGHGPNGGNPAHFGGGGGVGSGGGRGMNIDVNPLADYDLQTMVHDGRGKPYYNKNGNGSLSRYHNGEMVFMEDPMHQLPPKAGQQQQQGHPSIQHRTLPSTPASPLSSFYSGAPGSQALNHEYSEPHSERAATQQNRIPRSSSSSSSAVNASAGNNSNNGSAFRQHGNAGGVNPNINPPPLPLHSPHHNMNTSGGGGGRNGSNDFDWSTQYDHAAGFDQHPHFDTSNNNNNINRQQQHPQHDPMETNPLLMYHPQQQQQHQQQHRYPPSASQQGLAPPTSISTTSSQTQYPSNAPLYFQTIPTSDYGPNSGHHSHKSANSSSSGGGMRGHHHTKHKKRRKRPHGRDHHHHGVRDPYKDNGVRDQATNTDLSSNEGTIEFTSFRKSGSSSNSAISNGDDAESDTGAYEYDDSNTPVGGFQPPPPPQPPHHHHHLQHQPHLHLPHHHLQQIQHPQQHLQHHHHHLHPHHQQFSGGGGGAVGSCDRDSSFANNGSLESVENRSSIVSGDDYNMVSSQELSLPL